MPTPRKLAPFGLEVTRRRSQPSRQPALDVKVIHRIAELKLELLNIVHDHYGLDLPTVTPMYIPMQGAGGNPQTFETCRPSPELGSHCEGPGQSVRKLLSRFQASSMSSRWADVAGRSNRQKRTFPAMFRFIAK